MHILDKVTWVVLVCSGLVLVYLVAVQLGLVHTFDFQALVPIFLAGIFAQSTITVFRMGQVCSDVETLKTNMKTIKDNLDVV